MLSIRSFTHSRESRNRFLAVSKELVCRSRCRQNKLILASPRPRECNSYLQFMPRCRSTSALQTAIFEHFACADSPSRLTAFNILVALHCCTPYLVTLPSTSPKLGIDSAEGLTRLGHHTNVGLQVPIFHRWPRQTVVIGRHISSSFHRSLIMPVPP